MTHVHRQKKYLPDFFINQKVYHNVINSFSARFCSYCRLTYQLLIPIYSLFYQYLYGAQESIIYPKYTKLYSQFIRTRISNSTEEAVITCSKKSGFSILISYQKESIPKWLFLPAKYCWQITIFDDVTYLLMSAEIWIYFIYQRSF